MNNQIAKIGVVTVSDRASAGVYEDLGGPAIKEFLTTHLTNEWVAVSRVVPDEVAAVSGALIELADDENCCFRCDVAKRRASATRGHNEATVLGVGKLDQRA